MNKFEPWQYKCGLEIYPDIGPEVPTVSPDNTKVEKMQKVADAARMIVNIIKTQGQWEITALAVDDLYNAVAELDKD